MAMEQRKRLLRGSVEVQTVHSQAMRGTPTEVPVPRKVTRIRRQPAAPRAG